MKFYLGVQNHTFSWLLLTRCFLSFTFTIIINPSVCIGLEGQAEIYLVTEFDGVELCTYVLVSKSVSLNATSRPAEKGKPKSCGQWAREEEIVVTSITIRLKNGESLSVAPKKRIPAGKDVYIIIETDKKILITTFYDPPPTKVSPKK